MRFDVALSAVFGFAASRDSDRVTVAVAVSDDGTGDISATFGSVAVGMTGAGVARFGAGAASTTGAVAGAIGRD